ncbi:MAG: isochorismatase family protein [Candidatus Melainabacteria bacterium]|nr:isochorismatase family protein [Candidatus Melainabacteria bacterium]
MKEVTGSMISKKRHPNLFTKENSVVLLIDYQERFVPHLYNNEETIKNIKLLLSGANIYKVPIIVSEQVPEKLGPTIGELKELLKDAKFFSKKSMSCCGKPDFVEDLKKNKIEKVAICGIEAHVCVLQTSLDLIHNSFQVHLASDAISTMVPHNKEIALEKIKSAGGIISSVETILFEIAYEAGSEEFKRLQHLFK